MAVPTAPASYLRLIEAPSLLMGNMAEEPYKGRKGVFFLLLPLPQHTQPEDCHGELGSPAGLRGLGGRRVPCGGCMGRSGGDLPPDTDPLPLSVLHSLLSPAPSPLKSKSPFSGPSFQRCSHSYTSVFWRRETWSQIHIHRDFLTDWAAKEAPYLVKIHRPDLT